MRFVVFQLLFIHSFYITGHMVMFWVIGEITLKPKLTSQRGLC